MAVVAPKKTAITRFRTQKEYSQVKRAAKLSQLSLNEFIRRAATSAAENVLTNSVVANETEAA